MKEGEFMDENKIGNIESIEMNGQVAIKSENSPFATSFYFDNYYDDKAVKKFIKSCERMIRHSTEYKLYIEQLRSNLSELNRDVVQGNITTLDADLEFHHYPFSLYDLIEIYMIKAMLEDRKITTYSVSRAIMDLHYKHHVGLVPLGKTNHELVHDGKLFISENQIFGNFKQFARDYDIAISMDLKAKLKDLKNYTEKDSPTDFMGII